MPITLCVIAWKSHLPLLLRAAAGLDWLNLKVFSSTRLNDEPEELDRAMVEIKTADAIFLYRSTEGFWDMLQEKLAELHETPVVCIGHDPSLWALSTTEMEIVTTCHEYFTYGGLENCTRMFNFIGARTLGLSLETLPPEPVPWEGLCHPKAPVNHFSSLNDYLAWYRPDDRPAVGVLISRHYWVSDNLTVENAIISALEERGLNVIPVFSYSLRDEGLGTRSSGEVVRDMFITESGTSRIHALIKLQPFFLEGRSGQDMSDGRYATPGVKLLQDLNVPVFGPITAY